MINKHFKNRTNLSTQALIQMKTFTKPPLLVTHKPRDSYSSIQQASKICTSPFKWQVVNKNLSVLVSFMRPLTESPVLWTMWHGEWQQSECDPHLHTIRKRKPSVNERKLCRSILFIWNESAVYQIIWLTPCLNMRSNSPADSSAPLFLRCNFSSATAFSST